MPSSRPSTLRFQPSRLGRDPPCIPKWHRRSRTASEITA
jgi:hypothetical protein